jgi:hypothetical protein
MSNPERVNDAGLKLRVRHSFTQCLSCFRLHPEIWHDLARFEALMGGDDITIANTVYKEGMHACRHTVIPPSYYILQSI